MKRLLLYAVQWCVPLVNPPYVCEDRIGALRTVGTVGYRSNGVENCVHVHGA